MRGRNGRRKSGYPERFAQEALGHNSKAVHRAYAKKAKVRVPSLEEYERRQQPNNIVPLPPTASAPLDGNRLRGLPREPPLNLRAKSRSGWADWEVE